LGELAAPGTRQTLRQEETTKSETAKAIAYSLTHRTALTRIFDDGRIVHVEQCGRERSVPSHELDLRWLQRRRPPCRPDQHADQHRFQFESKNSSIRRTGWILRVREDICEPKACGSTSLSLARRIDLGQSTNVSPAFAGWVR
jgi:hypothetical protein